MARVAAGHLVKVRRRNGVILEWKEAHKSRLGYSAADIIVRMATRPGGSLAVGARPNRSPAALAVAFIQVAGPTRYGHRATAVRGQYNKPARKLSYRKTVAQLTDLEEMWQEGERSGHHVTAKEAHERMGARRDAEGRLFYSHRTEPGVDGTLIPNPNGILLDQETCKQWFTIRTAKNRKQGNGEDGKDEVDRMKKAEVMAALVAESGSEEAARALVEARTASAFKSMTVATLRAALRTLRAGGVGEDEEREEGGGWRERGGG